MGYLHLSTLSVNTTAVKNRVVYIFCKASIILKSILLSSFPIAVIAACFANMHQKGIDYRSLIDALERKPKVKKGAGFAKREKLKE